MSVHHRLRSLWLEGRIYTCNHIVSRVPSHATRLSFYRRVMKAKIDSGSCIHLGAKFDCPTGLQIGRNSTINERCRLDTRGGINIGSNTSISADVIILTASHDIHTSDFEGYQAPVRIGDHVFVGTRAMVLPGVTIGDGAVVAAGAVVARDVSPGSVVAGIPATQIGARDVCQLDYSAAYRRFLH
jgi:acetyltransferase-like isoleucine patch superfamily enzyme